MKITFLGTGTSTGVPQIGCKCPVCASRDTKDKRLRTSVLVETEDTRILLDCGPDFRQQMMNIPFAKLDAVLLSHEHYDHVGGIDDLRPFCKFGDLQIYAEENVSYAIKTRMPYCFTKSLYPGVPRIIINTINYEIPFKINKINVVPIRVIHGKLPILGFRIGPMAYLTDVLDIPEKEFDKLKGLKLLIINALRNEPHQSHQTLMEAINKINKINPEQSFLIHMSHQIGLHEEVNRKLPQNIQLSYDGLKIEI